MIIPRIFGVSDAGASESGSPLSRLPIGQIRQSLQAVLHDCKDMRTQHVIYKINIAQTPAELWLLRSDLQRCVAQVHNEAVAAERINSLVKVFEGWVPASQLLKV